MPSTTTNLGLLEPVGSDAPSELRIAIATNATTMDAYSLLTGTVTNTVNANVLRGQSVIASPSTTQTLPSATANAMVAITASSTVTAAAPVTVAGANIYGRGLNAASSFKLGTPGAFAVLQSDGTNWLVIGGEQDTGWLTLTLATNIAAYNGVSGWSPAVRVRGDRGELRGALVNNTGGTVTSSTGLSLGSGVFAQSPTSLNLSKLVLVKSVSGGGTGPTVIFSVGSTLLTWRIESNGWPSSGALLLDDLTFSAA